MSISNFLNDELLLDWIANHKFGTWRVITLKYPYLEDTEIWRKALTNTFRELEQRMLRASLLTTNKDSGKGNRMRRLIALGGEKSKDIRVHAHGITDNIGDKETFQSLLTAIWKSNLEYELNKLNEAFVSEAATVYLAESKDDCRKYVAYMLRREGPQLGSGVLKAVGKASHIS